MQANGYAPHIYLLVSTHILAIDRALSTTAIRAHPLGMANPNQALVRSNANRSPSRSRWLARAKDAGNAVISTAGDAAKSASRAIGKPIGKLIPTQRPQSDGIANVVGGEIPGALTLGVLGAVDKSRIGQVVRDKIGVSVPILSFGAAILGRVTGIDGASPVMRRTGTRVIKGMVNVLGLEGGGALMDAIGNWEKSRDSEPTKTAGTEKGETQATKPAAKSEKAKQAAVTSDP